MSTDDQVEPLEPRKMRPPLWLVMREGVEVAPRRCASRRVAQDVAMALVKAHGGVVYVLTSTDVAEVSSIVLRPMDEGTR